MKIDEQCYEQSTDIILWPTVEFNHFEIMNRAM